MNSLNLLKDKVAIVTGGTCSVGYQIAKTYLKNGAKVALFGSREETVNKAINELKKENPNYEVIGYFPKLTDYNEVESAILRVKEIFGKIDILVNNAGVSARDSIYNYNVEDFDKTLSLNVNGVFYPTRAVVSIMKEQGGGVILNTSSMVGEYGQPAGVAYPTSKFAVNGMTKSLARELGKDNIRVNAVAPGVTKTDMVAALPEQMVKAISANIPLGRVGEPEDVANAFLFLASDLASYITGVTLRVDGATMC